MNSRQWFYARGQSWAARGHARTDASEALGMKAAPRWAQLAFALGFNDAAHVGAGIKLYPHQREAMALLLVHPTRSLQMPRLAGLATMREALRFDGRPSPPMTIDGRPVHVPEPAPRREHYSTPDRDWEQRNA